MLLKHGADFGSLRRVALSLSEFSQLGRRRRLWLRNLPTFDLWAELIEKAHQSFEVGIHVS